MASFSPPAYNSDVFDSGLFNIVTETLTLEVADARYLKLSGGTVLGYSTFAAGINVIDSFLWNGVAVDLTGLTYVSGITPGTATASKAIVVDSNKDISAFRNLTATNLTGTLQTAAQPNITSIGTLASLTATSITGTLQTAAQPNITSIGTLNNLTVTGTITSLVSIATTMTCNGVDVGSNIAPLVGATVGTVSASKALIADVNKDIGGLRNLSASGVLSLTGSNAVLSLTCASSVARTNIQFYGDSGSNWEFGMLGSSNTPANALYYYNNGYRMIIMPSGLISIGGNQAPVKQFEVNSTTGACLRLVYNLTTNLADLSVSSGGNLTIAPSSGTTILSGSTASTSITTGALTLAGGIGISNTTDATSTTNGGSITTAGGMGIAKSVWIGGTIYTNRSTSGGAFSAYCGTSNLTISALLNSDFTISTSGTTSLNIGTGSTTALTIDGFTQEIYGIGSLTATNLIGTNLTGTIQTASQPNITSVGTLSSLSTGSLTLGGTLITAYASEINTLAGVVAGSAGAGKALVLDMSKNIATINNLTSNYLSCNTAINGSNALGTMKALNLGGIVLDYGVMSLKGSGTKPSVSFGSTNSLLWMESSHGTPIEAEINVSSGTSSTSTNALRMGTCSNNDFNLFTNNTERVVIRAGGEVLIKRFLQIGDSTDTSRMISCLDSTMTSTNLRYITLGKTATAGNQAEIAYQWIGDNDDTNSLRFGFYGGEKMRLTRWGSLLVNSTNNSYSATPTKFASEAAGATEWCAVFKNTSNSTSKCMGFINNSSLEVGSITWGVGTTSFNTTSDYRLKKDVEPMTNGLELINRLNPVRYKWINSEESAEGFIAHELQDVLPHCVQGQRDAVYPDGSVNPQSVDYGKLTTTLVAAIQDLSAENQSLKARLERLEQLSKLKKN